MCAGSTLDNKLSLFRFSRLLRYRDLLELNRQQAPARRVEKVKQTFSINMSASPPSCGTERREIVFSMLAGGGGEYRVTLSA